MKKKIQLSAFLTQKHLLQQLHFPQSVANSDVYRKH